VLVEVTDIKKQFMIHSAIKILLTARLHRDFYGAFNEVSKNVFF